MPLRRKSNLSAKSRGALKKQMARARESEEDRNKRLSRERTRQAASRAAETASQRESRLRCIRDRTQSARLRETSCKRDLRRRRDRDRHATSRAAETLALREQRLAVQRIRIRKAAARKAAKSVWQNNSSDNYTSDEVNTGLVLHSELNVKLELNDELKEETLDRSQECDGSSYIYQLNADDDGKKLGLRRSEQDEVDPLN
ncbi:hypothetical protein O0L34_g16005 [Tuta absoluta]|nr:hypothetical protein O0L34_g16005 [Tuta absoluta]